MIVFPNCSKRVAILNQVGYPLSSARFLWEQYYKNNEARIFPQIRKRLSTVDPRLQIQMNACTLRPTVFLRHLKMKYEFPFLFSHANVPLQVLTIFLYFSFQIW